VLHVHGECSGAAKVRARLEIEGLGEALVVEADLPLQQ
jgi:hypothetical protein